MWCSHTHSDTPSSPQPPAQTSNHQPAVVGKRPVVWLCETRIPFSLSTHTPNTAGNAAMEKLKREEEEEVEWEEAATSSTNGCNNSHTASQLHCCACTDRVGQRGGGEEE